MYSMNVPDRFMNVSKRFKTVFIWRRSEKLMKTVGNVERLEKFEPIRNNALERILKNFHGTFMFTLQKRMNNSMLGLRGKKIIGGTLNTRFIN